MNAVTKVPYRPKIFIHAPYRPASNQEKVKKHILDRLRKEGFDPQEFHVSGIAAGDPWTGSRAFEVMRHCDGALILALMRWKSGTGRASKSIPSEYSHFEGALALACNLPTLVVAEEGMDERGILSDAGGSFVVRVPMRASRKWIAKDEFRTSPSFASWSKRVRERYDVFFGYCSMADDLAQNIKSFLTDKAGMRVLDWATDFGVGRTIMEEVARGTAQCRCGLFLFTKDDPIKGRTMISVPRDNVLLEAGYFMSAHSAKRMIVVREKGTKMPVDLGGMIYIQIERRKKWKKTAKKIAQTLRKQMSGQIT